MLQETMQISQLDSHLGYWLRYVSNQVSQSFSRKVNARGVTVAEWVVMRELYEQEGMPSALADRLGMTRGAISKLADRLAGKGLVSRAASDLDGRVQTLSLTAQGTKLVPKLAALADENDREFFGHLDKSVQTMIRDAMKEIVQRQGLRHVPVD